MHKLDTSLSILGDLAKNFSPDSDEYAVLALACKALIFSMGENVGDQFQEFVEKFNEQPSATQKASLRSMGISIEETK